MAFVEADRVGADASRTRQFSAIENAISDNGWAHLESLKVGAIPKARGYLLHSRNGKWGLGKS